MIILVGLILAAMGVCDHNCIILQKNRARCTLNTEIPDMLMEILFLERAVI